MAYLLAEGLDPQDTWCRALPERTVVRLGRSTQQGWDVPWDKQISREHADLVFEDDTLSVRRLEGARNAVHYGGVPIDTCVLGFDEEFRIGHTRFWLVEAEPGSSPAAPAKTTVTTTPSPGDTATSSPRPSGEMPTRVGHYEIQRLLGAGGMGSVYLARHDISGREVALKVLGAEQAANSDLVRRFRSEAEAAAQLDHPNIASVYEADTVEGVSYIAMEYINGSDIERLLKQRGTLPLKRTVDIVRQAARALQHAHECGIVHRDIKPSNLLITRQGTVKLVDMGLARSIDESADSRTTAVGTMVGTVDYIAPEQADDSHAADARSDIYSLGCTWYEMLTGEPPYPDGSLTEKINAHAIKPAPNPRDLDPEIPEALVAVLSRMMAKSPDRRHQSIAELLIDIETDTIIKADVTEDVLAALAESSGSFELEDKPAKPTYLVANCDGCRKSYRVPPKLAGKRFKCRECGEVIRTPTQ